MKDEQCVRFLQWALPQLQMRWPGFRKVRGQVCKRVDRRIRELGLAGAGDYRAYLQRHADEWVRLDTLCRITISRFRRDKAVFTLLAEQVLPSLVSAARRRGDDVLRVWSAGCASGEEPYTLSLLWRIELQSRFPGIGIHIVATDADAGMIRRALDARYESGSLKEVPAAWREQGFAWEGPIFCLKPEYRSGIQFLEQDIRQQQPEGRFDLVLCRNLVFTYFDESQQRRLLMQIVDRMHDGAALVLGTHEHLPDFGHTLSVWFGEQAVYRKGRGHHIPAR